MLFGGEMSLTSAYYDYILAKYNLDKFIKEWRQSATETQRAQRKN
jgi:hypothetical protein